MGNSTGVSRVPLGMKLSPHPLVPCLSPTEELDTHCLLSTGIRNRAVGNFVVLNAAVGRGPADLEAGGGLGVNEEVGGWAPGICGRD